MDLSEDAEQNAKFVRLDVAVIVLFLFIGAIGMSIQGNIGWGLNLATIAFILVGLTVARKWKQELAEQQYVELKPLSGILTGGIIIALLQTASGFLILDYALPIAIMFGFASGLGYDGLTFFFAFYGLPGEKYTTKKHPEKDSDKLYVLEEAYYIKFVEQEALEKQKESNNSTET